MTQRPRLTLVSAAKTAKRYPSKSTAFISGGYEHDPRHFTFAREMDRSTGELQPLKMPVPYLTIILWCSAASLLIARGAWILV